MRFDAGGGFVVQGNDVSALKSVDLRMWRMLMMVERWDAEEDIG